MLKPDGTVLNPQQKPLKLSRYLIEKFSRSKTAVLSLFSGTGTDIVAALQLGRPVAGVDRGLTQASS